jgi:hypothetical protein
MFISVSFLESLIDNISAAAQHAGLPAETADIACGDLVSHCFVEAGLAEGGNEQAVQPIRPLAALSALKDPLAFYQNASVSIAVRQALVRLVPLWVDTMVTVARVVQPAMWAEFFTRFGHRFLSCVKGVPVGLGHP